MEHKMNSERRLLYIIDRLLENEVGNAELAVEIFAEDSDKTRTNVRNSIKVIKEYFGDKLVNTRKGYHKLVDVPQSMRELYKSSPHEMLEIFEFISLFDAPKLEYFEKSEPALVEKIKKETKVLYQLFDAPFEHVEDSEKWKQIKKCVKGRRYASIVYKKNKLLTYNNIKPIRIVFAKNNWYLAALLTEDTEGEYDFTFFRLNNIMHVEVEVTSFNEEKGAVIHLENMQSLFERYDIDRYDVVLLVDKEVSSYFKQKKYLKSQKIIEEKKDGSLLVSYTINNTMEILPLIKQWLPHAHVLKPTVLKDEITQMLQTYLENT